MDLPIKTRNLYITAFDETMAESVHQNSLDEDNRRFVPDEVFETVDAAREAILMLTGFYSRKDSPLAYAILLKDGRQIGHVQAAPIENGWEIGYHIGRDYVGNGYATEAVGAFLAPVMERLGVLRMYGVCRSENMASRKVMEKCGFILDFCGESDYHGERRSICRYVYAI